MWISFDDFTNVHVSFRICILCRQRWRESDITRLYPLKSFTTGAQQRRSSISLLLAAFAVGVRVNISLARRLGAGKVARPRQWIFILIKRKTPQWEFAATHLSSFPLRALVESPRSPIPDAVGLAREKKHVTSRFLAPAPANIFVSALAICGKNNKRKKDDALC